MQRSSFIQHLAALGAFSFLPANAFKHYQKFYLLQCFIAGFQYYKGMQLLTEMKEGDMLELVREPANEYDDCAIALHWNKHKIGFIPACENPVLSRLLDAAALELCAEITHLNKQVAPWENLCIAVHFLKQIPLGQIPQNMAYMCKLETPHYTSYKTSGNYIARTEWYEPDYANNPDWYGFLVENSHNDSVYRIIHQSNVLPDYKYGEKTGDYLLINKNRLTNKPHLRNLLNKAEETLGQLDKLFDEKGYIVLSTEEAAAFVPNIESIVNVTDKLGRCFIELKF